MLPDIFPIYGPFSIKTFGLFIVIGLLIFSRLLLKDPRAQKLITLDQYINLLANAIILSIIGGRLLYIITNWKTLSTFTEVFMIWEGGFSLMGAVLMLLIGIPWYLYRHHIPIIPLLDRAALYLPLLQAVSRIGCFFAGCCYGIPTSSWLGIVNPLCANDTLLNQPLHPTQLYSAGILLCIFFFLRYGASRFCKIPGQLICLYLILSSLERLIIDFWRAERDFIAEGIWSFFSIPQLVAFGIILVCTTILIKQVFSTHTTGVPVP